ncbi:MAG: TetR family transcriptional regulator [Frankia sp.]|nr:TetR family transcriptional regulator [Frankia sp.]
MDVAAAELGLRERKKRQTRQAIRDAAVRLVADRGLENVTVEEIAQAANVSPRTFFNYFKSKEDALVGIDKEEIDEACAALRARPADEPPLAAVSAIMLARLADRTAHPDLHLARVQMHRTNPQLFGAQARTWRYFERRLAEVVAERTGIPVDEDPYPMTVVVAVMAVTRMVLASTQGAYDPASLHDRLRTALADLGHGLPPPAWPRQPPRPGA